MRKMAIPNAGGAVLLIVAALAVAGCGGGNKSSAPPPVTVTVAPTTPVTTTTSSTPTTTAPSATIPSTGSLKDCGSLTTFGQEFAKALAASGGSGAAGLGSQAAAFKSFASKAPEEIRGSMQIIGNALAKYAEALTGITINPGAVPSADVLAKLRAAAKEINQPAVAAAGQKISAWVSSHCHG
jgi:hypothetical protein